MAESELSEIEKWFIEIEDSTAWLNLYLLAAQIYQQKIKERNIAPEERSRAYFVTEFVLQYENNWHRLRDEIYAASELMAKNDRSWIEMSKKWSRIWGVHFSSFLEIVASRLSGGNRLTDEVLAELTNTYPNLLG